MTVIFYQAKTLTRTQVEQLARVMSTGEEHRFEEHVEYIVNDFDDPGKEDKYYLIAELNGVIIGFCRLWLSPNINEWIADGIDVLPSHRRKGIGFKLLSMTLSLAKEKKAESVIAHVLKDNHKALNMVNKFGFQKETDNYHNSWGEIRKGVGWQFRLKFNNDCKK